MRTGGTIALVLGLLGAAYFFLVYDISVPANDGSRIVNIGLMSERQNGLIFCGLLAVIGTILLAAAPRAQAAVPVTADVPLIIKTPEELQAEQRAAKRGTKLAVIGIACLVLLVVGIDFVKRFQTGQTDEIREAPPPRGFLALRAEHALECGGNKAVSYRPPHEADASALITVAPSAAATMAEIEAAVNDCMRVARESFDFTDMSVRVEAWGVRGGGNPTQLPVGNGGDAVTFTASRNALIWTMQGKEVLVRDAPKVK